MSTELTSILNTLKTFTAEKLLSALVLLCVSLLVIKLVMRILTKLLEGPRFDQRMQKYILSAVRVLLYILAALIVADSLGIPISSLLALFSVLGLAVSLAVKDSLSNLAGGLTILGTKPFKVGDYVQIDDIEGTVQDIGLVYTSLTTWDNRRILVPNSTVVDAEVTNYTTEPLRRVDLTITASYGASVEEVKDVIQGVLARHDKVLKDPAPFARLSSYGDNALGYAVRAWCRTEDYWDVYYDLLEELKSAFDAAGLSIPYPQMEVTLRK